MTRLEMAQQIVDWEARRDAQGKLRVYKLPSNDGGGSYEVAGINERYDPTVAATLKCMVEGDKQEAAEKLAVTYIANQTEPVKTWSNDPAIEFFLRDCCFNRGLKGAGKILQIAVHAEPIDGAIGPVTKAAIKKFDGRTVLLLARLRAARELYEEKVAPNRPNLRAGLENRWDNALDVALNVELTTGGGEIAA